MLSIGDHEAIVVGAGFAGLHMLHRLRQSGMDATAFEAGPSVGGTWYWNRYPGARCDFESHDYSYSFDDALQKEWVWQERYPAQPEILRYLNHVADRFDLRPHLRLQSRITSAHYDDDSGRWTVTTDTGEQATTRFLIFATGALSLPQVPNFSGLESFRGSWYHTANWPSEPVDFTGRRVAVIGTGSSGVQVVPRIAAQAEQLFVLQRTAAFVVPAHNHPLDPERDAQIKSDYSGFRQRALESFLGIHFDTEPTLAVHTGAADRIKAYEDRWRIGGAALLATFPDLLVDAAANETLADFLRQKISDIVDDPATAKALTPYGFPVGAKRLIVDSDYYQTFNKDNVELVDIAAAPIEAITAHGIRTSDNHYEVDTIVFATGFDALTGPLLNIDIVGKAGIRLTDRWAAGPMTYLGLAVAGFPNMFTLAGPGSPSVLSNVVRCTEHNVEWVAELLEHASDNGVSAIEASSDAESAWVNHVNELSEATIFPTANSWYLGANIPGKPRVFMPYAGGLPAYRQTCAEVAEDGYRGFHLT
ncbi:flavin-containing monooxygenase [Nocardia fusca]|uniref:flavin-containing monooxygenase n=1 Tax=Nocardia fusca TaxID=941183 RepID=UPI00378D4B77